MERQLAGGMPEQEGAHRFTLGQDLAAITLQRLALLADKGQQLRLGDRAAGVLGHGLDLLARRDLLQLDELAEQAADRDGIADWQLGAAAFGDLKPDLIRRQEAKA